MYTSVLLVAIADPAAPPPAAAPSPPPVVVQQGHFSGCSGGLFSRFRNHFGHTSGCFGRQGGLFSGFGWGHSLFRRHSHGCHGSPVVIQNSAETVTPTPVAPTAPTKLPKDSAPPAKPLPPATSEKKTVSLPSAPSVAEPLPGVESAPAPLRPRIEVVAPSTKEETDPLK